MTSLLAINWAEVGIKAGQLILSLSILVILHEFGHYITARWFKCRVEKFFLFFDPWFSLVKRKVGETEYGIGWLPLGGYVKIAGMIDESMDKEALKQPPQEWEFRSKPAWQRLIVMLGGVIMNILTAFVIYAFILMIWGDKKVPSSSMKFGVHVGDSTLMKIGLRSGDRILGVDGKEVYDLNKFKKKLITAENVQIERDGQKIMLNLPKDFVGQLIENKNQKRKGFIEPRFPALVYMVSDTSVAYKAGLRKNDMIVGLDSNRFLFFDQLSDMLDTKKNKDVLLTVNRGGKDTSFVTHINGEGQIGFNPYRSYEQLDSLGWLKFEITKYNFLPAFPAGVKMTYTELTDYVDQFKTIFTPGFEKHDRDNLFIVGVFSLLDAILKMPMQDILEKIQLPEPVSEALLSRTGIYGPFLQLTEACEGADSKRILEIAELLQYDAKKVNECHIAALAWAETLGI